MARDTISSCSLLMTLMPLIFRVASAGRSQYVAQDLTLEVAAPVLEFYMYRAGQKEFPASVSDSQRSANFANAAGVLRYIHNEVVGRKVVGTARPPTCERKYNIEEIYRFKVTMRSTPEAITRHSSGFLGFVAIDKGQCTVPQCEETWWKPYGYVPGCQDQSVEAFKYADALWYSFPGKCPSKTYEEPCTEVEEAVEPGGACRPARAADGTVTVPDGTPGCTYVYEPAGRVSIDELVGIQQQYGDYKQFCSQGGVEFNGPFSNDDGVTLDFWKEYNNVEKNKQRTAALLALFKSKYPDMPDLDDPGCSKPFVRPSYWPSGTNAGSDAMAEQIDVEPRVMQQATHDIAQRGPVAQAKPASESPPVSPTTAPHSTSGQAGPVLEFYMYRAGQKVFPATLSDSQRSANFANAAGVLRYIHNEVVGRKVVGTAQPPTCERKYNIEEIYRFKVAMRSTPEAIQRHSSGFLGFVAIDKGQCTVPECEETWWKPYGYVPGCQDQSVDAFKYADALWYSFPGKCPSKTYEEPCTEVEEAGEPGGACRPARAADGTLTVPDGTPGCTYVYEPAGRVSIDELVGIQQQSGDYKQFCSQGGVEFNGPFSNDDGVTLDFWKEYNNVEKNKQRTAALLALFKEKYPDMPDLDDPGCSKPFDRPSYWPDRTAASSAPVTTVAPGTVSTVAPATPLSGSEAASAARPRLQAHPNEHSAASQCFCSLSLASVAMVASWLLPWRA